MHMKGKLPLTVALLLLSIPLGMASLFIEPPFSMLSKYHPSFRLIVLNNNDHKAYISMEVVESQCVEPKAGYQCAKRTEKPTPISKQLIFTNSRFILAPGQHKVLYATWKGALPDHPVMLRYFADDHAKEAISRIKKTTEKDGKRTQIMFNVKTIYQAKIFVLAADTQSLPPQISKSASHYTLYNPGTAPIYVRIEQRNHKNQRQIASHFISPKQKLHIKYDTQAKTRILYFDASKNTWKDTSTS